jgi:uncharacterized membrane protein YfcA
LACICIDRAILNGAVGVVLVLVAGWLFCRPRIALGPGAERFVGPPIGLLAGIIGGMSGMFGPPLIAYMVGLGRRPNEFVKHISIAVPVAGAILLLALGGVGAMSRVDIAVSAGALVPIYIGMVIGRRLRRYRPPGLFRALALAVLAIGGLQMIRAALL